MKVEMCVHANYSNYSIMGESWWEELRDTYGLIRLHESYKHMFKVTDESMFGVFMLKYPECIKKIVYE